MSLSQISEKNQYHYFYKITNLINNHFYYGVHNTNNLEDGYMGSGTRLHIAYKKYGIENFKKEILKYFDTAKEAFDYEANYITMELVKDPNCYNIQYGGDCFNTTGMVAVRDKNGNRFEVFTDDPRYLSGELVHVTKDYFMAKDKNGNRFRITKDDPRWISGELVGLTKGIPFSEEFKEKMRKAVAGKHVNHKTCKVCNENEIIKIKVEDREKYLQMGYQPGEHFHKIKVQSISDAHKRLGYQVGEKNSQYGKCWIHNNEKSISIKKEQLDEYLSNGWIKGRKMFKK